MHFEIIGRITDIETIAIGSHIRLLPMLRKQYGSGRWRKLKGIATIQLSDGALCKAEIHWYEATGIGKRELKIKRLIEGF